MKHFPAILGVVFSFCLVVSGAATTASEKKLIVRFATPMTETDVRALLDDPSIEKVETLVPSLNLYLVKFKAPTATKRFLNTFSRSGMVKYAQPDHVVKLRQLPNDPNFKDLWSLNGLLPRGDIGATKAWDIGTGGKDALGQDIVVAVVDGGMDINHVDLKNNLWANTAEIGGNGVDDDQNGYIDDIHGWNAFDDNGTFSNSPYENFHGTHVAGIIGAEGNNGTHVTGLNWKVKIMPVAGASGETSVVAKAYGYVLAQKKLWIESNGKKGANIVATNSSFGVDGADCNAAEFAVWNDLYTAMGEVGILSAVATSNAAVNVDTEGDVPTGCSSPYIVAVTNTTIQDEKYDEAGFGAKHIHLGAPGTDILSTIPENKMRKATGTSMATPHVTGAIALLHSVASANFHSQYRGNLAEMAKEIKAVLLKSVDPIPSLKGITVSEGRLNVYKAALTVSKY